MMRALVVSLAIVSSAMLVAAQMRDGYNPPNGFVPDEATAIKIAVAVWEPVFGVDRIAGEKPFHATLRDGIWIVGGTLPKGMSGGTAIAEISKDDGRIIRISHDK